MTQFSEFSRKATAFATEIVLVAGCALLFPTAALADDSGPEAPAAATEAATVTPTLVAEPLPESAAEPAAEAEAPIEEAPAEASSESPIEVVVTDAAPEEVLDATVTAPTVTVFAEEPTAAIAPLAAPPGACAPAVCIDNGTILLAVNPTGELNTQDATGSPAGSGDAGLAYLPTGNDATSPGCLCEGWGVADPASGVWGGANLADLGPGGANLTVESFTSTPSTATSVVLVNNSASLPIFRVTHEYVPAAETPNLYQVNVTIENVSGETIAVVQYRRVMDWDIEPTAFSEYVTLNTGTSAAITFTSDDGFAPSNPLSGPSNILATGNFTNSGPEDHGALFDFTFGALAPGEKHSFITFYGAAGNEAGAVAALTSVGAEAYSLGKPNLDPLDGSPNTFIFAFGKVGGAPIFPTEPTNPAPVVPAVPVAEAVVASVSHEVVAAAPAARTLEATGGDSATTLSLAAFGGLLLALGAATVLVGARRARPDRA